MAPVALDWTFVQYDDSAPLLGQFFGFVTFSPFVVVIGVCSMFFCRREIETLVLLGGLIGSFLFNKVLKRLFQQPRPRTSTKHGYGMPSDHAQFMFFFATYAILWLSSRHKGPSGQRQFATAAVLLNAITVSYSRVFLGFHTPEQVLVGALIGMGSGLMFHHLLDLIRPYYRLLEPLALCQYLLIKDSGHIPNILQFERDQSRRERALQDVKYS